MILEEETYRKFGYYSRDLKPRSGKKILVACDNCGKVRINKKGMYRALCINCSLKAAACGKRLNRMPRFEDLYARFILGYTSWDMVVKEIKKKAREANPYALNIWRLFDKDFSFSDQVHSAIRAYYSNMLQHKRTKKAP